MSCCCTSTSTSFNSLHPCSFFHGISPRVHWLWIRCLWNMRSPVHNLGIVAWSKQVTLHSLNTRDVSFQLQVQVTVSSLTWRTWFAFRRCENRRYHVTRRFADRIEYTFFTHVWRIAKRVAFLQVFFLCRDTLTFIPVTLGSQNCFQKDGCCLGFRV